MRKKKRIKHPLILYMGLALIPFIGGTIMLFLDKYLNLAEYVNLIVGISLGVYALGWLILFFKNFSKIISREEKTKITQVKLNAFNNKRFTLIQKRCVIANFILILGGLCVYLAWFIFIPLTEFGDIGCIIFGIVSIVFTILGAIFSFVVPQKMLVYQNGLLIINTKDIYRTIKPSELKSYSKVSSYPKDKNRYRQDLYSDVVLHLENEDITLRKADCEMFLKQIVKVIKEIEQNFSD